MTGTPFWVQPDLVFHHFFCWNFRDKSIFQNSHSRCIFQCIARCWTPEVQWFVSETSSKSKCWFGGVWFFEVPCRKSQVCKLFMYYATLRFVSAWRPSMKGHDWNIGRHTKSGAWFFPHDIYPFLKKTVETSWILRNLGTWETSKTNSGLGSKGCFQRWPRWLRFLGCAGDF